jgi:hypothetical protein
MFSGSLGHFEFPSEGHGVKRPNQKNPPCRHRDPRRDAQPGARRKMRQLADEAEQITAAKLGGDDKLLR